MIALLQGKIELKTERFVVLVVQGLGYKVFCSAKTLDKISPKAQEIKLYTHLVLKENAWELYGFLFFEELEFFELLIGISGIGPKIALNILSTASVEDLEEAIILGQETILNRVTGIGKKMAERIILELKSKVKKISKTTDQRSKVANEIEAIDALVSLGYSVSQAREALRLIPETVERIEDRIKEALRILGK